MINQQDQSFIKFTLKPLVMTVQEIMDDLQSHGSESI